MNWTMGARYIIRLDDACPTMNIKNWDKIESILDRYNLKPIVCVIPDNKDRGLFYDKPDPNFWARVKNWQNKGWAIAMHGFQHLHVPSEVGLVPINKTSEFVGLSLEEQKKKIKKAWNLLIKKGIKPTLWTAPLRSYDYNTLLALELETDIRIISDDISFSPFYDRNFYWIPQQLWSFKMFPFGLWSIILHPSTAPEDSIDSLGKTIELHRTLFTSFSKDLLSKRKKNLLDVLFRKFFLWRYYRHKLYEAILE